MKSKYQLLINRREKVGIKKVKQIQKDSLIQTVDDVYKSLKDYNPTKEKKVLIVFDNMIADMEANKKINHIVT